MFVMLLGSFTYAQTDGNNFSFACSVSPVADGTRAEKLEYVQTLITSNTTIVHSYDTEYNGNQVEGDVFTVFYEGSPSSTYIQRPIGIGPELLHYGNIEDMVEPYLTSFYMAITQWVNLAQSDYDNAQPTTPAAPAASASASNTLSDQTQIVYSTFSKDAGRALRNNALRAIDPIVDDATDGIVISISADTVLAHQVVVTLYNTGGTPESYTSFNAGDYGNSDMPLMTVGEFNDYFDAIWNHVNN